VTSQRTVDMLGTWVGCKRRELSWVGGRTGREKKKCAKNDTMYRILGLSGAEAQSGLGLLGALAVLGAKYSRRAVEASGQALAPVLQISKYLILILPVQNAKHRDLRALSRTGDSRAGNEVDGWIGSSST
jgi:hypothetical protein